MVRLNAGSELLERSLSPSGKTELCSHSILFSVFFKQVWMHFLTASVILPQSRGCEVRIEGKVELSHQYSFLIKIHFTNSNCHELSEYLVFWHRFGCSSVCPGFAVQFLLSNVWPHVQDLQSTMKEPDRMELDAGSFLQCGCGQLELCCSVSVLQGGDSGSQSGVEKQVCSQYTTIGGENTFSIQARAAVVELRRPWVCCPFQAGALLRQVKLESRALLSAVCQLAVNIYCFSCCKASSQHVREKCFNVLKAQSTQQWSFLKGVKISCRCKNSSQQVLESCV